MQNKGENNDIKLDLNNFLETIKPAIVSWGDVGVSRIVNRFKLSESEKDGLKLLNTLLKVSESDINDSFLELAIKHKSVRQILIGLVSLSTYGSDYVVGKYSTVNFRASNIFNGDTLNKSETDELLFFFQTSGLRELLLNEYIEDLTSVYCGIVYGVNGSNSRKNSTGSKMECLCNKIVSDICKRKQYEYITQATSKKIMEKFGIKVNIDKKRFDFVIKDKNSKLYFIEVNYYSTDGSKIKACCQEYYNSSKNIKLQGHEFLWITDGNGWHVSKNHLAEVYEDIKNIVNFNMIEKGILDYIIK